MRISTSVCYASLATGLLSTLSDAYNIERGVQPRQLPSAILPPSISGPQEGIAPAISIQSATGWATVLVETTSSSSTSTQSSSSSSTSSTPSPTNTFPPAPAETKASEPKKSGLSAAALGGIAGGGTVLLLAIGSIVFFYVRKRKKERDGSFYGSDFKQVGSTDSHHDLHAADMGMSTIAVKDKELLPPIPRQMEVQDTIGSGTTASRPLSDWPSTLQYSPAGGNSQSPSYRNSPVPPEKGPSPAYYNASRTNSPLPDKGPSPAYLNASRTNSPLPEPPHSPTYGHGNIAPRSVTNSPRVPPPLNLQTSVPDIRTQTATPTRAAIDAGDVSPVSPMSDLGFDFFGDQSSQGPKSPPGRPDTMVSQPDAINYGEAHTADYRLSNVLPANDSLSPLSLKRSSSGSMYSFRNSTAGKPPLDASFPLPPGLEVPSERPATSPSAGAASSSGIKRSESVAWRAEVEAAAENAMKQIVDEEQSTKRKPKPLNLVEGGDEGRQGSPRFWKALKSPGKRPSM